MSISDERLRQLSELKKRAQDRIKWFEEQKERLETMENLVASVPSSDRTVLSESARMSTISRGERRGTESITDSVRENRKTIKVLERAIAKSQGEMAKLEEERQVLEEAWGKNKKTPEDIPRLPSPEKA